MIRPGETPLDRQKRHRLAASRVINSWGRLYGERNPCYRSIRRAIRHLNIGTGVSAAVFSTRSLRRIRRHLNME